MRRIEQAERRARLALRHHLVPSTRVDAPVEAARGVVCLHATDPTTVYLSAWARMSSPSIEAVERALYDDRSLVRMLAMRRTMFVVPTDDVAVVHAAAALAVGAAERRRNEKLVSLLGVEDPSAWLTEAEAATLAELERRGEATARELAEVVDGLRRKVRVNVGKRYEGDIGISSRVLLQLGLDGKVVRGRPRGSWVSSQYRWATAERWLGGVPAATSEPEARAEVVRRWLARFGPGTEADLRWWTGWPARSVRAALAAADASEVELDGRTGFVLRSDVEPTPPPDPWVALLPALDPTTMGWQARDWYLGPYRQLLFDANGNGGPTVWVDGRIVGGWATRPGGEVVTKLLEDVGRERSRAIDAEAARLTTLLDGTQIVPRFASPLHRELVA